MAKDSVTFVQNVVIVSIKIQVILMTAIDWKAFATQLFKLGYVVFPVKFEPDPNNGKDKKIPILSEKVNWKMEQFRNEHRRMTQEEFDSLPFENAEAIEVMCDIEGFDGKFLYGFDFDFVSVDFSKLPQELQNCYREQTRSGNWRIPFKSDFNIHSIDGYKGFELLADSKMMVLYDPKILESQVLSLVEPKVVYDEIAKALGYEKKTTTSTVNINKPIEELLTNGVSEGERDNSAIFLASKLRILGKTKDETTAILLEWNQKNNPPLPDKTILEKVQSAYSYEEPLFNKKSELKPEAQKLFSDTEIFENLKQQITPEEFSKEISLLYLRDTLNKTIKFDDVIKLILFLSMLGAFTEDEQTNCYVSGGTSSGKTWCLSQVAWFFYKSGLFEYSNASPKSFYYSSDAVQCERISETEFVPIDFSQQPKEGSSNEDFRLWYDKLRKSVYFRNLERTIHLLLFKR
jgi:hypothetical protein